MKTYIALSMSRSRKDAKEHIEDLSLTFALHITHLFFFDSKENNKHWRNELSSYLQKCWGFRKISGGKVLSIEDLTDFLYKTSWESKDVDGFYNLSAVDHNSKLKSNVSLKDAKELAILKRIDLLYSALIDLVSSKHFSRFLTEKLIKEHISDWWEFVKQRDLYRN